MKTKYTLWLTVHTGLFSLNIAWTMAIDHSSRGGAGVAMRSQWLVLWKQCMHWWQGG